MCMYRPFCYVKLSPFKCLLPNRVFCLFVSLCCKVTKNPTLVPADFKTWAAPSEFVSSSIPSWQILTAHAQPFRGARDLAFCLKVPLDSLLVWASSGGSGEIARMRRLAWTFAARIGDKYQIRLTRSTCDFDTWLTWAACIYFNGRFTCRRTIGARKVEKICNNCWK